jgi:hypothetical protein
VRVKERRKLLTVTFKDFHNPNVRLFRLDVGGCLFFEQRPVRRCAFSVLKCPFSTATAVGSLSSRLSLVMQRRMLDGRLTAA